MRYLQTLISEPLPEILEFHFAFKQRAEAKFACVYSVGADTSSASKIYKSEILPQPRSRDFASPAKPTVDIVRNLMQGPLLN